MVIIKKHGGEQNTKEDLPEDSHIGNEVEILPWDIYLCYTNGSWLTSDARSGQGLVVAIGDEHVGLKGSRLCLSPLHTELDALVGAMKI